MVTVLIARPQRRVPAGLRIRGNKRRYMAQSVLCGP
jgi:hypothetical protein